MKQFINVFLLIFISTTSILSQQQQTIHGKRMPRLTTQERNELLVRNNSLAKGLTIHNIDVDCLEYWNGTRWVSLCEGNSHMTISPEPCQTINADGAGCDNEFTITDPDCQNGPFSIVIVAGGDFAYFSSIDETDGKFQLSFHPNNSINARTVIVRVISSCTGLSKDFLFMQNGQECMTNLKDAPFIHSMPSDKNVELCAGGAVYLSVKGYADIDELIWTRNSIEIARGVNHLVVTQAGVYDVSVGFVGCGRLLGNAVTVTRNPAMSAASPAHIIVSNYGILCGPNGVILSALNAPNPATGLIWMKDGLEQARDIKSCNVPAGVAGEGTWYSIYTAGDGCYSLPSNAIPIVYTNGGDGLVLPDARINEKSIDSGSLVICAGGTLELTIDNISDYSGFNNVEFEWFGNGQSLGKTTAPTMYVVPPTARNLVLSVVVSATGECPMSKTSNEFTVITGQTPLATSINRGDEKAFICATNPAVLTAGADAKTYQWFRNGQELSATDKTLSVTQTGAYTVRYTNEFGCWSLVSAPIEVVQSAPVSISWLAAPATEEILESSKTYSVVVAPDADIIEWSVIDSTVASVTKLGHGNSAIVTYYDVEDKKFSITVKATNACGTAVLPSDSIHVKPGCVPAGSVVITPSTIQTIEEGQSITFTASANIGTNSADNRIKYTWFVDGVLRTTADTNNSFTYTSNTAKPAPGHQIVVTATNTCTTPEARSAPVSVIVTINPITRPLAPNTLLPLFTGGKTCLDAHVTDGKTTDNPWLDGERLPLSVRPNDFNNGQQLAFTYKFSASNVRNIRFVVKDPQDIVQSVSGDMDATTATAVVTFKSNIRTTATGTTKNTPLSITLYAVFFSGIVEYQFNIPITIQDQSCGCPAKVSSTTWQMFQCHNLGADVTLDPFNTGLGEAALRGNYYAWGRKLPVRNRNLVAQTPPPAGTAPDVWTELEDPCPAGWRVGLGDTWRDVLIQGNNTILPRVNGFYRIGDYLWLPPVGYFASIATATLTTPGSIFYWTRSNDVTPAANRTNFYIVSATATTPIVWGIGGNYVENIRCVQEGAAYAEND